MEAEDLFLERCGQIERLLASHTEIELLDLAGLLRQLLLDGTPLVHKVNNYGLKLKFEVGLFRQPPDKHTAVLILEDGLDPDTRPPRSPSKEVNLDGFLEHTIIVTAGKAYSVSDVIKFAANVSGGVHHVENPKGAQKVLSRFSMLYSLGGLPAGVRQLKAICRVTLKGLSPLIAAVKRKDVALR
jgi:hypothetical protein